MSHTRATTDPQQDATTHRASPLLGMLPFIGVILFVATAIPLVFGDRSGDWKQDLVRNGVIYMVGWAGVGAGISHLVFGRKISASIGWAPSPYELEVGFADLAMGITGLLAGSYGKEYWLAAILVSSIFRVGCGIGHVRQMIQARDFAPNNTAVLFVNFVVPAVLVLTYFAWT